MVKNGNAKNDMKHTFSVRIQDVVVLTYSQVGTESLLFIISIYTNI